MDKSSVLMRWRKIQTNPPISAAFPFAKPYKGIPKNNDSSIGPANTTESKYRGILGST